MNKSYQVPLCICVFLSLAHNPWASRMPSMNTYYPCTLIHGNLVHLYHPWEPCAHYSSFFYLALMATLFVWPFIFIFLKIVVWAYLVRFTLVWAQNTRTLSLLHLRKGSCSCSICERNFHNLATLPHTVMGSNTIYWRDNTLESL